MKKRITLILCILLVLALGIGMTGCMEVDTEPLDQQVRTLLDCCARQDMDGAWALMYPGSVDRDSFRESFERLTEECPVSGEYSLTLQNYHKNTMLGTKKEVVETAQYLLELGDQSFEIAVELHSDANGSGFTNIQAAKVWSLRP
jgi:hypothetical protein